MKEEPLCIDKKKEEMFNSDKDNNTPTEQILPDHISLEKSKMYFISDLHIGDGSYSEPLRKKELLIKFLRMVQEEDAQLVLVGDGLDLHQAFHGLSSIIEGNSKIFTQLRSMNSFHYVRGNHDHDMTILQGLIEFSLHNEPVVDNKIHVQHGHQYDPYISNNLEESSLFTIFHHLTERILNCQFRLPIENHYNFENRCAFWFFHKLVIATEFITKINSYLGWKDRIKGLRDFFHHWSMNQVSDPANIFENVRAECLKSKYPFLLVGHSHFPGKITFSNGNTYVNTGSWTWNSSQYAVWNGTDIEVRDFDSGQIYTDSSYKDLSQRVSHHLDFLKWWNENYMGWLRFRNAEYRRYPRQQ